MRRRVDSKTNQTAKIPNAPKGYRGYISARATGGGRTPQHVQNLVIRDYAIFMLRPDGTVSSWNEGARQLKGYTAEEILGQNFRVFYTVEDCANLLPERLLARALAEGRCEHEVN